MIADLPNPIRKVTDGVSKTIMFVESAGRPNLYDKNKKQYAFMWDPASIGGGDRAMPGQATGQISLPRGSPAGTARIPCGTGACSDYQWADERTYAVWGTNFGGNCPLTTIMNCDNYSEPYSFHVGGANMLLGDGSVVLLSEDTSVDIWISMLTAAADDIVGTY
jgi:prepilin-type processing-associated H-X9-DG protein